MTLPQRVLAIAAHPEEDGLWRVRNSGIIGRIGMWKTNGEPKFLEQAVIDTEARVIRFIKRELKKQLAI